MPECECSWLVVAFGIRFTDAAMRCWCFQAADEAKEAAAKKTAEIAESTATKASGIR